MKVLIEKYVVDEVDVPDEYVVNLIKEKLNDLDEDEIRANVTAILTASARGDIDDDLHDMIIGELEDAAYDFERGVVGEDWHSRSIYDSIDSFEVKEDFDLDILTDQVVDMIKEEFDD